MYKEQDGLHNFFMNIDGVVSISKKMLSHVHDLDLRFIETSLEILKEKLELNENQVVKVCTVIRNNEFEYFETMEERFTLEGVMLINSILEENNFEIDKTSIKFLQKNYIKTLNESEEI